MLLLLLLILRLLRLLLLLSAVLCRASAAPPDAHQLRRSRQAATADFLVGGHLATSTTDLTLALSESAPAVIAIRPAEWPRIALHIPGFHH
jgi:hypothetical protein